MIISATCTSISDSAGYTHVSLDCDNGMTVRLMFKGDEACPYQFRQQYSIEIAQIAPEPATLAECWWLDLGF
jgi:hypothetical protein